MFRTVEIHYLDGDPRGMRFYSIGDSVIQAVVVPVGMLKDAKRIMSQEDMPTSGVYFLVGEEKGVLKMYAGQTVNGVERFYDHKYKKPFWTMAVLFVSKKFTGDALDALESLAIKGVVKSRRYESDNKIGPEVSVSMFKRDQVEKYYADVRFIMETLNWSLEPALSGDKGDWHTKRKGIVAYGRYSIDGFDVLPGSRINMSNSSCLKSYLELREQLLKSKKIVEDNPGEFVLTTVQRFNTPSGASDFVMGCATNGWTEWVNDKGEKLDIMRKHES